MTSAEIENLLSRLAFRAAMKEAFAWDFPLPDDALKALLESPEFDEIFKDTQPTDAEELSPSRRDSAHYTALANDQRVQVFLEEFLAKQAEKNKQADYVSNFLLFLGHEFKLGLRKRLRRFLNPPEQHHKEKAGSDAVPVAVVPVAVAPVSRHPVLKGTAVVLLGWGAILFYKHPPDLKVTMIAPEKFPQVEMDSRPVRFDKVQFDDVRFEKLPELQVAKLRFGDPPTLPVGKVHFETPPPFSVYPLTLAAGSHVSLDASGAKIGFDTSQPLKFAPLEVKAENPFKLQLDPESRPLQVKVDHSFDGLFGAHPQATFTDKRQGFFRPSHTYTWEVTSLSPPPQNSQQGKSATPPASKTTQDPQPSKSGLETTTPPRADSKSTSPGGGTDQR